MNPHARRATSIVEMFRTHWRHRELVVELMKREVLGRYRGSLMGITWSFFNPLFMLAIYTFVFAGVFKARWGAGPDESVTDFAVMLFVGMIVHGLFAECANRAPGLVVQNANLVKKVIFPLEVLPAVVMGSALFHLLVSLGVLLLCQVLLGRMVPPTVLMFPVVVLPLVLATLGVTWLLAGTGVYYRDIGQAVGLLTTALLFLSPVFYSTRSLPEPYQVAVSFNPLTGVIENARAVLILGAMPDFVSLGLGLLGSVLLAWVGFWWFQRVRVGFSDVV
jgi:lipopolysaccharide transport system permease protein